MLVGVANFRHYINWSPNNDQSFIYVISTAMCLKLGMVTIFKTPPQFFNE